MWLSVFNILFIHEFSHHWINKLVSDTGVNIPSKSVDEAVITISRGGFIFSSSGKRKEKKNFWKSVIKIPILSIDILKVLQNTMLNLNIVSDQGIVYLGI